MNGIIAFALRMPRPCTAPAGSMSRTEARGDPATGKRIRELGRVHHDEMQAWLRGKGVRLVGGGLDEAPQAYRRLPDVLAHHRGTVKIEHTLRPFAVFMAGADVSRIEITGADGPRP